nr:fumarate reductase (CoM/CoB) subunit TfrA [Candidatus Njordarchaeota archaeon]
MVEQYEFIDTDVLVIGGGGAGCRAAIEASNHNVSVILLSKELFGKAHTIMAEGGYNAALGNVDPQDNPEVHFKDTVEGGAYLNNQKLGEILVRDACERVLDLENFGGLFDRTAEGKIAQRLFGKQTYRRTCYASDRTGHEMMVTLAEEVRRRDIRTMDEVFVSRLLMNNGTVVGATAVNMKTGGFVVFRSKSMVLATGGTGRIYSTTTNALQDTGDGYALGFNCGAYLVDMEQFQFHPTGVAYPESARGTLVTEAVRGEGGVLYNALGERFMKNYNPKLMEVAGRDEVARSIANEILEGRGTEHQGVFLDVSHLPSLSIEEKLSSMLELFLKIGIDIRNEPMEVSPTAHHLMGGLKINERAETTVKRLFGAGEVTGGIHGGNRLGGNALADTQVFGKIAGENAAMLAKSLSETPAVSRSEVDEAHKMAYAPLDSKSGLSSIELRKTLQKLMWNKVGIFRTGEALKEALNEIVKMRNRVSTIATRNKSLCYNKEWIESLEIPNMLLTAEMVTRAALMRKESRGAHYRKDFNKTDNRSWLVNIHVAKDAEGMKLWTEPVLVTRLEVPL